ncbi:PepSY-associated TM helix domain-containing protein [Paucibacter sp. DJ1R-11]|uniref:PepSY-associated TM helix domain-containing protein n=1 Tax=Paucibacter sp. DJ1R-11 TaxID=2893556 RepID=UPI0021E3EEC4|nr:PepSY-associated TM helix domain-containing protein [Paucibacter sp. DJ1R-11]MCV2365895.1 PepSY-associated TM helix domain-containing protein [Paucibacter sp. DJ1R-11]
MTRTRATTPSLHPAQVRSEAALKVPGKIVAVQWLRKSHGWIGLWGASLGLLFGFSGIWLNHRAVLKLPDMAQQRNSEQVPLPSPSPANAEAMAQWLQQHLRTVAPASSIRTDKAKPVPWAEDAEGGQVLMQPERWTVSFAGPKLSLQAEYWRGNKTVNVRRTENGLLATLTQLHKGSGMTAPWILLVDTLAGSIMLLSLSGVALWMLTHRRRAVGLAILGSALSLTLALALS